MAKIPARETALSKLRVSGILASSWISVRDRRLQIWNYVLQNETIHGSSFLITKEEGRAYLVIGQSHEILPMPPTGRGGDRAHAHLNHVYGLERTELTMKTLYEQMRTHCVNEGTPVDLRRFSAYDTKNHTVYLSTYDGHMWRCSGSDEGPERVQNGEDEVFFIDDDRGQPTEVDIGPHDLLFDKLTSLNYAKSGLGGITPEQQKMQLIVWMFALAFPDLMPTKPLVILEGPKGAGKTSGIQLIQLALLGRWKAMAISKNQESDFGVLLLRSPIGLLDNIDTYISWLADKVATYATSGEFPKRKLYSDDEEVSIKPHSFPAVATRNPASFRRDDVVDRLIIFRLDRYETFTRLEKLKAFVETNRGKLLGEYLYYVNQIVKAIREGAYDGEIDETHRMADFAAFARVVAGVMGWSLETVDELMAAMQAERDMFAAEDDPTVSLIHSWLTSKPRIGQPTNIGKKVSSSQLFEELQTFAQANHIQWLKGTRQLVDRIRMTHVQREFIIETTVDEGQHQYRIWRQTDARLRVVEKDDVIKLELGK